MDTAFEEESYYEESFAGVNLAKATIKDKEFENCTFRKCVFIECMFDACKFLDCTFEGCSISANKPYNSQFANVTFRDSKVMGFDWTKARSVRSLVFERCDLGYSDFSFLKLPGLKLLECTAKEVNFNGTDLTDGILAKTDFEKAVFSETNLSGADLRGAVNYSIDIHFNTLKKARFSLPEANVLLRSLDIILE